MKITCPCGAKVADNTDGQRNKAYLIPDEDLEDLVDEIDASESSVRGELHRQTRRLYQCWSCGRLLLDLGTTIRTFAPDEPTTAANSLGSVHGERRRGQLTARWKGDVGELFWSVGIDDSCFDHGVATLDELETRYRTEFERLRDADLLEGSRLWVDGETRHQWNRS